MPPKPKRKDSEDDFLPEDQIESEEEDQEEEWDPEYTEKEPDEEKDKNPVREDDEHDDLPKDSDAEEEEPEVMVYQEDEDEIEPPAPELIRNMQVVAPEDRTTSERLSIFECARILGERARHIDNRARPYIDTKNYTSSLEIAYNELLQKRIPMAVVRNVGQNKVEVWRVREKHTIIPKLPPQEWFMTTIH